MRRLASKRPLGADDGINAKQIQLASLIWQVKTTGGGLYLNEA